MTQVEQLKISGQLPSPKGIALAILELSQRDNATLGEIARVVQTDPALSGRLIKLANTASRIARPVVSVQEAVVRQGMSTVRQLALGFSLLDQYREGACDAFDYQTYWSHSLLMALSMQALGERVHVAAPDEMFICGLLAQVGRLALATAYPEAYHTVLTHYSAGDRQTLAILERTHLETDHTELGGILLSDWGLPRAFIGPLAQYEYAEPTTFPQDSRTTSLILMLRLSHQLADLGLAELDARPALARAWMSLATELDMPLEASGSFIDEVIIKWRDWGTLLNIPTSALPPFAEMTQRPPPVADSEAPMRIVVADANALTRHRIMGLLVEEGGHVVYPVDDGNAALAMAMEVLPHVILAHHNLPKLSGADLCQALRATEEGKRMHIVLMADEQNEENQARAYEVGADAFAPSNINAMGLRARMHAAQRQVQLQNAWSKDRAQLRQTAAELAVANRRLANAALTDLLTGLPNRRSAMDQLEQAWSASTRSGTSLAVMVIDIDYFKQINDTYGHATGDLVLREVARSLRASARREDSVCRIGGEEFLVICPNTDLQAAMLSAERLRTHLENKHIPIGQNEKAVTSSIGVAVREPGTVDADALVNAADRALYLAKEQGRNRVCTLQLLTH
ncbi:MAG: diguanylate cyclase [Thiobacillus sp.]|nr:diguanylate cyclase [Thiobacillus sp.]